MQKNILDDYMYYRSEVYETLVPNNLESALLSESNWIARGSYRCGEEIGIHVQVGDIAYLDYGQAYLNEMGYQHFGLVLAINERKALIIPMTSNARTYANAYDEIVNPEGKKNLFGLPDIVDGLFKKSVLFLNDLKFINTARIIEIKAHLDPESALFHKIQLRVMRMLFDRRSL